MRYSYITFKGTTPVLHPIRVGVGYTLEELKAKYIADAKETIEDGTREINDFLVNIAELREDITKQRQSIANLELVTKSNVETYLARSARCGSSRCG